MGTGLVVGLRTIVANRGLVVQLTARDISARYKNTVFGGLWVVGQPLLQLLLYGFVFQVVLKSRWGLTLPDGQEVPFGLVLFAGILLHGLIADTLVRAPSLIVANQSYVKRVIFPLEVLPLVNVISSLVTIGAGLAILIAGVLFYSGQISPAIVLIPIPLALLGLLTVGLGWLLAALGVFLRDLGQFTSNLATILLFTAPICYPAEMVPESFQWLLSINPLTIPVECVRQMLFDRQFVAWEALGAYAVLSLVTAVLGYLVFARMRKGFADAL